MTACAEVCEQGFVSGRVQGVGFRAWLARQARALALSGWVRNRADGRVEFAVRGTSGKVRQFLAICKNGPVLARIDALELVPVTEWPEVGAFEIQPAE